VVRGSLDHLAPAAVTGSAPSLPSCCLITEALEKELGCRLDPRELVRFDDLPWPTASVCQLVGCPGCLPDEAYETDGRRRPEWKDVLPGCWSDLPDGPDPPDPPDPHGPAP
jgi:hypothetical protein